MNSGASPRGIPVFQSKISGAERPAPPDVKACFRVIPDDDDNDDDDEVLSHPADGESQGQGECD